MAIHGANLKANLKAAGFPVVSCARRAGMPGWPMGDMVVTVSVSGCQTDVDATALVTAVQKAASALIGPSTNDCRQINPGVLMRTTGMTRQGAAKANAIMNADAP